MSVRDPLLLLYADRSEPVTAAILDHSGRFERDVIAISLRELVDEVEVGERWTWAGRTIDPARAALVNRLTSIDAGDATDADAVARRSEIWRWLHRELKRFAYSSSEPTVHSPLGGYGSLLDQWLDLPLLVGGLRVPRHQTPWGKERLEGDVFIVNPAHVYSLGRPASAPAPASTDPELAYVRPGGWLVHATQVGGMFMLVNAPPTMTQQQADYIGAFARTMAERSTSRILEHAFFVGVELPVFYATFPIPILSGKLPDYPELVVQGLNDDIKRRSRRGA